MTRSIRGLRRVLNFDTPFDRRGAALRTGDRPFDRLRTTLRIGIKRRFGSGPREF
jgi:hypothetical protein